ncbi:hypothetical protein OWM54_13605 [Myxococcus sp. MISCRS1]|uniref:hypothetical protein n=1 Tax=Myxococcus TaxID=32 RepID=UPI001CBB5974|nr:MULTISPECIES: hypothetical protein [unclassified Myxococcus]MBZ4407914.1 hypothetical protein [Myxococcus sp. XM-1-1-1]MCY0998165.1 hypothetical protein [Myxococcus sp. MISCRS1]
MSRLLPPLLLLALLGSACSTLRGRADELARNGQFVEAASLYDDLVAKDPHDKSLVIERDGLRGKALSQLLGNARRFRLDGIDEKAEDDLLRFLDRRVQWNAKLSGGLESSLLEEMEGTHRHLRAVIVAPASQGHALTAEEALIRKRPLLAHKEMVGIQREMESSVLQSGKDTCGRLKAVTSDTGAHWREVVSRYCRHWREPAPEPAPAPELTGVPTWEGQVSGLDSARMALLRSRLARAYELSPWYSPAAKPQPELLLAGRFDTRRGSENVAMTAPYTERVPYTDHEERKETIEEPFEADETYTDKDGKTQTRKVTKVRTYTRNFTVPVTRYRDVARTFEYHALRLSVEHQLTLSSSGVLDARRAPLATVLQDHLSESSLEHDVHFEPGEIRPRRASFTSPEGWLEQRVELMARRFAESLSVHWRESYCDVPMRTLDEASRCARAGTTLPTPAHQLLSEVLGDDAARIPALFVNR